MLFNPQEMFEPPGVGLGRQRSGNIKSLDIGDLLLEWLRATQQIKKMFRDAGPGQRNDVWNSVDGGGSNSRDYGGFGSAGLAFAGDVRRHGPQSIVVGFVTNDDLKLSGDDEFFAQEGIFEYELDSIIVPTNVSLSEFEDDGDR
jgi:hypothetical protein